MNDPLFQPGRPTKYHKGLCEDLLRRMQKGETNVMVASGLGISEATFYSWLKEHDDFKEVYDVADTARKAYMEGLLIGMAQGDIKGDFKALIAYLNNKYGYSGVNPNNQGNTIQIGNMNVLNMDQKDIDKRLEHLLSKYNINYIEDLTDA